MYSRILSACDSILAYYFEVFLSISHFSSFILNDLEQAKDEIYPGTEHFDNLT